jgi:hypothetical protein
MVVFSAFYQLLHRLLLSWLALMTENLALRQQLLILRRSTNRPRLRHRDRWFWIAFSQLWQSWRSILLISQRQLANGIGKASSATGAGSLKRLGWDAPGLISKSAS